ncbi:MAG: Bicyclomycin resistance protein [Chlamydiae bacterium]|nr:Bicyclomycin resistance protein [Chlamydiota bacterium]
MKVQKLPLFNLLFLFSLGYIYFFIFSPTLPMLSEHFQVSVGEAQLTMTIFLLGFAISQLIYAPIANAFGRKKAIYFGCILAILGALMALYAYKINAFTFFLTARLIMAFGACVGTVLVYTMIADVYNLKHRKIKIIYLTLMLAVMNNVAVFIGGFLLDYLGVNWIFYFLILYAVLVLISSYFLPETAEEINIKHLRIEVFCKKYLVALKDPRIFIFGLISGFMAASIISFATVAPFIMMNQMKMSATDYGTWMLVTSIGLLVGSLFARFLAGKLSDFNTIVIFSICAVVSVFVMFLVFVFGFINPYTLFFPVTVYYIFIIIIFPNSAAMAIEHAVDKATSSSAFAFVYLMLATLTLFVMNILHEKRAFAIPLNFLVFMCAIAILLVIAKGAKCDRKKT